MIPKRHSPPAEPQDHVVRNRRAAVVSAIAHEACLKAPRELHAGAGPWWEQLDRDFAHRDEGFSLRGLDRLRVAGTATVDRFIRTSAALSVAGTAFPIGFRRKELRQSRDDAEFYGQIAQSGDAKRFFPKPTHIPIVRVRRASRVVFRPQDGIWESLRFESNFEPTNPRLRDKYLKFRENRHVRVRYWRHKRGGPRPTVVAIHGFGAEGYALNQWFLGLPYFYETLGFDVALFNLPFHGRRQSKLSPFSGHRFFAGGPAWINEAFAQAVWDFRTLLNYLEQVRGVTDVGTTGVSLGGCTAALLAATDDRLRFSIPNVPVVSLADLMAEWRPIAGLMRAYMKVGGVDIVDLRKMLAVSCPLSYPSLLPTKRLMVIGGVGDRVVPPKHSRLLWDHWNRPRLHWFPGGHILHVDRRAYFSEIAQFASHLGLVHGGDRSLTP